MPPSELRLNSALDSVLAEHLLLDLGALAKAPAAERA